MSEIYQTALNCYNDKDKEQKYDGKFDCSGFVVYCYNQNKKTNVPHSSAQIWNQGSDGDGSAGDIACWDGHVGICVGDGRVIHSYHKDHIICRDKISDVSKWDKRPLKGFKRF